jgi:hypothetical protein
VDQTAGGDNLLNTTIIEGLTDDVRPIRETLTELFILAEFTENLLFGRSRGILLLEGYRESLKECFVKDVSTDESSVIRSFTLSVSSSENLETF